MLWFYLFIASISVGGLFALLVAVARTPFLSELFPPRYFYHALVGHVDTALIVGLYSFLVFLWHRVFKGRENRLLFWVGALGFLLVALSSALGLGEALWNNYVPTIVHPLFFSGISLFFLSVFLNALYFAPKALPAFLGKDALFSVLSTTVINSLLFPLSLLLSLFTTQKEPTPHLYFESLFWFPGHIHQFVNAGLLISVWLLLLQKEVRSILPANALLVLFPFLLFVAQLFLEPLSELGLLLTKLGYAVGIGIPTIAYGLLVLREALRERHYFAKVSVLSVLIYFLGALMGYTIAGTDTRIPAHYHTVIASILVGLMALTLRFLKEFSLIGEVSRLVKLIPFVYGLGMLMFSAGLFWAGLFGAPRKTPGTDYIQDFKVFLFMLLMGAGSILSVLGGASFVLWVLRVVLVGAHEKERGKTKEV
ncbi:MAG: cytochrome C oxidase subunit I [Aquificae bacterium]|nr:cytochrome C oxidase subunit I [Aquificota bacterium]